MFINRKNIVITRPISRLEGIISILPSDRFNIYPCLTITFREIQKNPSVNWMLEQLATYEFAIFTSQIAVIETITSLKKLNMNLNLFNRMKVCAVGQATADCLREFKIKTDMMPSEFTGKALTQLFSNTCGTNPRVLFPRGNRASDHISHELTRKGYQVYSPIVYKTEMPKNIDTEIKRLIDMNQIHCIALTSPSAVESMSRWVDFKKLSKVRDSVIFAAIGPVTASACVKAGAKVTIQPPQYTIRSLGACIADYYSN